MRRSAAPVAGIASILVHVLFAAAATAQDPMTQCAVDSNGVLANEECWEPAISGDGRYVSFTSRASNLVPNDNNGWFDIFVHDLVTGATVRVSVSSTGVEGDCSSNQSHLSGDGRFVSFYSCADNLVANDTNLVEDIFVHDRDPDQNGIFDEGNGVTTRVSVDSNGVEADDLSWSSSLSADGRLVAFDSFATNLVPGDTNHSQDAFVHDRTTGVTTRVSVDWKGIQADSDSWLPKLSADGTTVAFVAGSRLVALDTNDWTDVYVLDLVTNALERVSVASNGSQGNENCDHPSISSDGAVVSFDSYATNLVSGDLNAGSDVFVRDRTAKVTTRASVDSAGAEANDESWYPWISSDGQTVCFESLASNLVASDDNDTSDVFVHDRATGETTAASVNCAGTVGNGMSFPAEISYDGEVLAFESWSTDLVESGASGVFAFDRSLKGFDAYWQNYGSGFPGTLGIPSLTSSADPVFGTTISIDFSNSYGFYTPSVLLVGLDSASIPTSAGGTILVDFLIAALVGVGPGGASVAGTIPVDEHLCGVSIYLQVLELDPGAAKNLSFTPGLQLAIGH
jgi:hypothetical protein